MSDIPTSRKKTLPLDQILLKTADRADPRKHLITHIIQQSNGNINLATLVRVNTEPLTILS